jgi:antitoxin component YwqK of YwqJK toxin-antitoxin module
MKKGMRTGLILICSLLFLTAVGQEINQTDDQGRKQGRWIKTAPDGILIYEGQFVDDKPVGEFKRYYEDGSLQAEMNYRSADVAYAKLYYPGKELVMMAEGKYINQEKDSVWLSYDSGGQLKGLDTYKKGVRHGRSVVYHINGAVSEETTFKDDERHGEWKQFYQDGQKMAEGTFDKGERTGEYVKYYPNGKDWVKGKYVNGFKESTWIYGNENGSIGQMVVYRRGKEEKQVKMNGTFTENYDNDQPKLVENYKNGKLHGEYIEYYNDGKWVDKQVDHRHKGGELEIHRVLEGQTIKLKAEYKDGELHGALAEYDEKGKIIRKENYVNGQVKK